MSAFVEWLAVVVADGESVLASRPVARDEDRRRACQLLEKCFRVAVLDVAGPPIEFDPETAWRSATVLAAACWNLISDDELPLPQVPDPRVTPGSHFSADLTFRFLPSVLSRARTHGSEDPLANRVVDILRRWPLSGVLADIAEPPTILANFPDHAGLRMLYAERLVTRPRPGWVPTDGQLREHADRAFREVGKPVPIPVSPEIPK